jgi:hypothetical protein
VRFNPIPHAEYGVVERKALAQGQLALTALCEHIRAIDPRASISFVMDEIVIECADDKRADIQAVFDSLRGP